MCSECSERGACGAPLICFMEDATNYTNYTLYTNYIHYLVREIKGA